MAENELGCDRWLVKTQPLLVSRVSSSCVGALLKEGSCVSLVPTNN